MSDRVPLHKYEKAKKKAKIGNAIGTTLVGIIVLVGALGLLFLFWALLYSLWTAGAGGIAIGIVVFIVALGTALWLTNGTEELIADAERYGTIDE